MSQLIEIDISTELEQWLKAQNFDDTLESSVLYVLEQAKRSEAFDRCSDQRKKDVPPLDVHDKR